MKDKLSGLDLGILIFGIILVGASIIFFHQGDALSGIVFFILSFICWVRTIKYSIAYSIIFFIGGFSEIFLKNYWSGVIYLVIGGAYFLIPFYSKEDEKPNEKFVHKVEGIPEDRYTVDRR